MTREFSRRQERPVGLTRRELLRQAGGAALALPLLPLAAPCGSAGAGSGSTGVLLDSKTRLPQAFAVPLPIPPVLKPTASDATTDYYEITQMPAKTQIVPGLATEIWGYNGLFPGPTIEARSGRRVVVRHHNQLPVPTVVHLHGGVTPPDSDGYPTDLVLPTGGAADVAQVKQHADDPAWSFQTGSKDYAYPLDQRAATLWYHDHRMDFTGPQVYRGLAGFFIVRDAEEDPLPLPRGEREIPLLICDRAFANDGSFHYPAIDPTLKSRPGVSDQYMEGVMGDVILVNGAPWPILEVAAARHRFRILNASNARRYRLALDPPPKRGSPFSRSAAIRAYWPGPSATRRSRSRRRSASTSSSTSRHTRSAPGSRSRTNSAAARSTRISPTSRRPLTRRDGTLFWSSACASMGTVPMVTTTLSHVGAVAASANLKENFPAALALTILFLLLAAAVFIGGPALWRKLH